MLRKIWWRALEFTEFNFGGQHPIAHFKRSFVATLGELAARVSRPLNRLSDGIYVDSFIVLHRTASF
jgi:hypothetical protein